MLRLGLIDCDTSHVVEFTKRLNHVALPEDQWVSGARVVAAIPGESLVSPERIPGFVAQLDEYGVRIVDSLDDLIGEVDAILVESVDGSVHRERALPVIAAGLPLFVDKPLATSTGAARDIITAARRGGVPLFSASALRYAPAVVDLLGQQATAGAIQGATTYGPATLHPRNPGLFHYGVHAVEMLYALLGAGCRSVRCVWEEGSEVVVGRWADGRIGSARGLRQGRPGFGATVFFEGSVVPTLVDFQYCYRDLLKVVVEMLGTGQWPLSATELFEPIAFIEAANESARRGGDEVDLARF